MQQQKAKTAAKTGGKLLKGAAILGAAAIISKLLGTLQKVPLQNIAGDSTYGLYNAVYPFYILILVLATAGLPIAVSKFVSEKVVEGDILGARRILRVSSSILTLTGCVCFGLLYFGAEWLALLIDNSQTELAFQSVAFALLFVPVMAALRGYFQGFQNMTPTAVSQVVEQFIRVAVMLTLLLYLVRHQYSEEWIAAGATFGSAAGAAAGLIVMLIYWLKERAVYPAKKFQRSVDKPQESYFKLTRKLVWFAIPVCLGAAVLPLLNIVDTVTVFRLLKSVGYDEASATHMYGIYNRGLPLVQLVAMLFSSISVAIVPAIAEAWARKNQTSVRGRAEVSIRLTWLIGLASSAGLAIMSIPLNIMFFTDSTGSKVMAVLAFTTVFSVINIVTGSVLQGLGQVGIPVKNLLIAALIKVLLNIALVPYFGIMGAAVSAVAAFAAACILNVISVVRIVGLDLSLKTYFYRPFISLAAMAVCLYIAMYGLDGLLSMIPWEVHIRVRYTIISLFSITVGAIVYIAMLFRAGAITEQELNYIPGFNERWRGKLKKLHIIG
jgi:O-antigen/teichoic acid export membrane protein